MAKNTTPYFTSTIVNTSTTFTNLDTINTPKTIFTAGIEGSKINNITVSNTSNNSINSIFKINGSIIGSVVLTATTTFNILSNSGLINKIVDISGNFFFYLAPNDILTMEIQTLPVVNTPVTILVSGENY